MQTLAEKYPEAMKSLKAQGFVSLTKVCGQFVRGADMARALGMFPSSSGISKWMTGRNMPKWSAEIAAKKWLQAQKAEDQAVTCDVWKDTPPAKPEPPMPAPTDTILIVVAPAGKADKVQRVLSLIGCDVVEV
jgi:hypothetical protein